MEGKSVLPKEVDIEVLRRLPVKSLFRFKMVCKDWYCLIRDHSFITQYSLGSKPRNNNKILCFRKDPLVKTYVMSLLDYENTEKVVDLECPPFHNEGIENKEELHRGIDVVGHLTENREEFHTGVDILGPVNGIYCIYHRLIEMLVGTVVLWNPATRECKQIFSPIRYPFPFQLLAVKWNGNENVFSHKYPTGLNIGFGFVHNANDYKLVVISQWQHFYGPDNDGWHVKVYNLSTDSWRTIYYVTSYTDGLYCPFEEMFPRFPNISSSAQFAHSFLNGAYHWPCTWQYNTDGVLAFHMENESFQLIMGPSHALRNYSCRSVWVLKGTLTIVLSSVDFGTNCLGIVEVWMMKEYGVEDSWTILQSFGPFNGLRCIGVPNEDQIFFCDDNGQLISYDFKDHARKEYNVCGLCEILENSIHLSLGVLKYAETILPLRSVDYYN